MPLNSESCSRLQANTIVGLSGVLYWCKQPLISACPMPFCACTGDPNYFLTLLPYLLFHFPVGLPWTRWLTNLEGCLCGLTHGTEHTSLALHV